jgi:NHS family xanthosine MFS transporter
MGIKGKITLMNFLQFFIWGSWLISFGGYMGGNLGFQGSQIGNIYATMGIASLFMPALMGIVADKWINAERLLGLSHMAGGAFLLTASFVKDYDTLYWIMLFVSMTYMPTIALNNTVSYSILERNGFDIVKDFPPIRVWGTVGFIAAMWLVDLLGLSLSPMQLYIAAGSAFALGIYAFTMPACPPENKNQGGLVSKLGLDAFVLLKQPKMFVFFFFALLLGAALQITNTFGEPFLHSFSESFKGYFAVEHPGILMSVSQISETVFILTIPFFLKKFGIKKVMLMSMVAWVLRFGLFAYGDPGHGLWMLVLSMIIYGMAFDFFNISGSLFVEMEAEPEIRASAQGLFMIITNGLGAYIGGVGSGKVVDYFTVHGVRDWSSIWLAFAGYALVIAVAFVFLFRYKHDPKAFENVKH